MSTSIVSDSASPRRFNRPPHLKVKPPQYLWTATTVIDPVRANVGVQRKCSRPIYLIEGWHLRNRPKAAHRPDFGECPLLGVEPLFRIGISRLRGTRLSIPHTFVIFVWARDR
ncbi:MAG: hypothetical protein WBX25_03575, partial [Rhodomicrobium sp.]